MNDSTGPLGAKDLRKLPLAMNLIVPLVIQAPAILAALILAWENHFHTILAAISGLIWLKLSKDSVVDEFNNLRAGRRLFGIAGEWLNREDSMEQFDRALGEAFLMDRSVEDREYREITVAAGVANVVRDVMSFLLQLYLLIVVIIIFKGLIQQ